MVSQDGLANQFCGCTPVSPMILELLSMSGWANEKRSLFSVVVMGIISSLKYGLVARRGVLLPMEARVRSTLPTFSAVAVSGVVVPGTLKALLLGTAQSRAPMSEDWSTLKAEHCSGYWSLFDPWSGFFHSGLSLPKYCQWTGFCTGLPL